MAVVAVIFAGLIGAISSVLSTILGGASLFEAFGVYMLVGNTSLLLLFLYTPRDAFDD